MNIKDNLLSISPMTRPGSSTKGIQKIVVHYVGNPNTSAIANRNYFENLKNQSDVYASAHYIVGLQGEIIRCIPENEVAWHAGNLDMNYKSLGIENCHPNAEGKFSDVTLSSLKELLADICKRYGLNPLTDIIRHYDVINTRCPRYYIDNPTAWEDLKQDVKRKIDGNVLAPSGVEYKVTATLGLNVRSEPNTNATRVKGYPYNTVVTIYEVSNGWGRTNDGWISMEWVIQVSDLKSTEYRVTATLGLNVRRDPNINSTRISSYPYNTIVTIYEVKSGWGRTNDGWVSMDYITPVQTQGSQYKVIATLGLNVRSEPNIKSGIVKAYKFNTILTIYEVSNGWGRTNDGWVSMEYLKKV